LSNSVGTPIVPSLQVFARENAEGRHRCIAFRPLESIQQQGLAVGTCIVATGRTKILKRVKVIPHGRSLVAGPLPICGLSLRSNPTNHIAWFRHKICVGIRVCTLELKLSLTDICFFTSTKRSLSRLDPSPSALTVSRPPPKLFCVMADIKESEKIVNEKSSPERHTSGPSDKDELINASGHVQELDRNFNLITLAGVGLVVGNVWPAVGGSILVAIFNGGPPGVIYEFIVVSVFYWIIAASLAELASAIPSSGGVYHWASVTPGKKWGRIVGFYAGYWNWYAWIFGPASMAFIFSNTIVQMWGVTHSDFEAKPWHVFVTYIISTWVACFVVCFGNKALPNLNAIGIFFILAGFLITVIASYSNSIKLGAVCTGSSD
jgi:hypothetical protein